jgi:hypothetical protein
MAAGTQMKNRKGPFKNRNLDWRLTGEAFNSQFDQEIRELRFGIYARIDDNRRSPHPIWDRNGRGKIIVLGSAAALKFGKFVGGVAARMRQNYTHFHRRPAGETHQEGIFPEVMDDFFVVDLTHREKHDIRPIETEWKRAIRAELKRQDLIHPDHRGRAESINLRRRPNEDELRSMLARIAKRILGDR